MILVTAEEMRALDRRTIESGHATGEALMERAGRGVVEELERRFGTTLALRTLVLCGTGNNGGDGFVAARHLAQRGARVRVVVAGDERRIQGDARLHLDRLRASGIAPQFAASPEALAACAGDGEWDLAIDALLGTGARGAPEGTTAAAVRRLRGLAQRCRVVAVDLPTGVDADTGAMADPAVAADLTVTFGLPKRGHALHPGRTLCGTLAVVDIGLLPPDLGGPAVAWAEAPALGALLPDRDPRAHKNAVGQVLVIGGSQGLTGAVALAARAATRAGAGYVQAAVPESLHPILAVKLTEEMTVPCAETAAQALATAAWDAIHPLAARADAIALGSGMSRDPEAARLARRLALEHEGPLVLDADGLNAFAGHAEDLARARGALVLTPHLGEMARLTGTPAAELEGRRIDAAREWAAAWRVVVVLKGAPTVTASATGEVMVNATGNPGMATAGMGDVLTGVVAALAAQGLAPYDAARAGVFLHGLAGDRVAARRGGIGMRAGDVIEELPRARRSLKRRASGEATRVVIQK